METWRARRDMEAVHQNGIWCLSIEFACERVREVVIGEVVIS